MTASPLTTPLRQAPPNLAGWTALFRDAEIPVLAKTAAALEVLRADEDAVDANGLGELIASDPLMSLKVLAYAAMNRSSRLQTDTETVTAALVLMGIQPFFREFGPQPTIEERLAGHPKSLDGLQRVLRRAEQASRYALALAAHRMDPDAAVIHGAAMLYDFAEMLLWLHTPDLALQVRERQLADKQLRSAAVQRELLNIELVELKQALMQAWRLPTLLTRVTDARRANDPQVLCVNLAVRLARHTADGWDDAAVPDDLADIGRLLNLSPAHALTLLQEYA